MPSSGGFGACFTRGDGEGVRSGSPPLELSMAPMASRELRGGGWFDVFLRMPRIRVSLPPGEVGVGGGGCGQPRVLAPGGESVLPVEDDADCVRDDDPSRSR